MSAGFTRMASETLTTLRPPDFSSGNRGEPEASISTAVACLPFDPVDPELRAQFRSGKVTRVLQTFVQGGPDIVPGDVAVRGSDSQQFPIRAVEAWYWPPDTTPYLRIICVEVMSS